MGCGACGRGGDVPRRTRGALGSRPCPLRGAAFSGWTGQVKGRRKPAWMAASAAPDPEVRPRGRRSRRGEAPRGVAVCLCFPAIREISRGCYQGAPFGVPPPSPFARARSPEPPIHVKRFAGSDDARPEKGAAMRQTSTIVIARLDRATQYSVDHEAIKQAHTLSASYAGLTRGSITLRKS